MRINIISNDSTCRILKKLYGEGQIDFNCQDKTIVYDYIIVFEYLPIAYELKCKENGLIFITGEPPTIRQYYNSFLKQFDYIITAQEQIEIRPTIKEQLLPPLFGYNVSKEEMIYSFEQMESLPIPAKSKNISIIVSNKTMVSGHRKRLGIVKKIGEDFKGRIDFYGKAVGNPIEDKADAILPYKFHICIENCEIANYWTEKIIDPLIGYSIPIYSGCTNIEDYFPKESMIKIDLDDYEKTKNTLNTLLENIDLQYDSMHKSMLKARELYFTKYSFFNRLHSHLQNLNRDINRGEKTIRLKPETSFIEFKIRFFIYRLKLYFRNK